MSEQLETEINLPKFVKLSPLGKIPVRATKSSAGYDLFALEGGLIPIGERALVRTGIGWDMSAAPNIFGSIRARSSLATKHGIDVGAGVVDADYTGEIQVLLINNGDGNFGYKPNDKIAQIILQPYATLMTEEEVEALRTGGFGSTGE